MNVYASAKSKSSALTASAVRQERQERHEPKDIKTLVEDTPIKPRKKVKVDKMNLVTDRQGFIQLK